MLACVPCNLRPGKYPSSDLLPQAGGCWPNSPLLPPCGLYSSNILLANLDKAFAKQPGEEPTQNAQWVWARWESVLNKGSSRDNLNPEGCRRAEANLVQNQEAMKALTSVHKRRSGWAYGPYTWSGRYPPEQPVDSSADPWNLFLFDRSCRFDKSPKQVRSWGRVIMGAFL